MLVIPIQEETLPLIAAINGGVPPLIEKDRHTSFIYHGEDTPNEIVESELIGFIMSMGPEFEAVETRFLYRA